MKRIFLAILQILVPAIFLTSMQVSAQNTLNYTEAGINFRNGQEYFEAKNYPAARAEFSQYLELYKPLLAKDDANKVWAEYYVTMCSLYMSNPETELLADRFVRNNPNSPQARNLFKEIGQYFFDNGDYEKAVGYLAKTAGSDPEAKYKLALSYFQLQRYNEAQPIFDEIKNESNTENGIGASYYSAIISFRAGRYNDAIPDFKKAEQSARFRSEIPNWVAHSYYRQGKFNEMLAYTEPILKQKGTGLKIDDLALLTAEVYFQQGNYEKAAPYYTQYANYRAQKMLPAVAYRYGYSLYRINQFAPAAEQLKNVAANRDTLGQHAAFILGISYLKANNPNYSLGAFDQARKLNFNMGIKEDADFNHAKVLLDLGRANETIREIEEFLNNYPNTKYEDEANELVSESYLSTNNYVAALNYIEGLKKRSPRINAAYQRIAFNQAVIDYNAEKYNESLSNFDKSLSAPENPELKYAATFWKAEALSGGKRYNDAISLYNQLIASSDNSTKALADYQTKSRYSLAYAYFNMKDYDKANAQFKAYADKMKNSGDSQSYQDALIRLADTYFAAKNYDQALKYYDQAITANKTDRDYAIYQKGLILTFLGKDAEAKNAFEKVQNGFPDSRYLDDAMYQKALLAFKGNKYTEAITGFTELINNQPKSTYVTRALLKRALAFSNTNNHEGAINDYKKIINDYKADDVTKDALAGIQEELNEVGRPEEFSQILNGYQVANPNDKSTTGLEYEAAKGLYQNENYEKAIQALSEYIKKYPGSSDVYEARYFIAESFYRLENKFAALRYYNLVLADNKIKLINRAAQRAAEIEFANGNYKNAITDYKALLSVASDKRDQQTAYLGLMESYYISQNLDSTIVFTRQVLSSPDFVMGAKSKASLYAGKIYMQNNDYVKATESFNQTISIARDDFGAEAQYLIAQILYNQKKFKESSEMILNKLRNDFPDANDKIMGKAFILLADDFVGMDNLVQARATLNSIIENSPEKDIVTEAKAKLKSLK